MKYLFVFSFWLAVVVVSVGNAANSSHTESVSWYESPTLVEGSVTASAAGTKLGGGSISMTSLLKISNWQNSGYPQQIPLGATVEVYKSDGSVLFGSGQSVQITPSHSQSTNGIFRVKVWSYVSPSASHVQWFDELLEFCEDQEHIWQPTFPLELVVGQPVTVTLAGGKYTYIQSASVVSGNVTVTALDAGANFDDSISFVLTATGPGAWVVRLVWPEGFGYCEATELLSGTVTSDHVVTITMAETQIERTQSVTGLATGGQNGYLFSVISGGVGIIGNSETGSFTVTGNVKGPYEIAVWSPAGNGYPLSNQAIKSGLVVDALRHKAAVTFDNRGRSVETEFRVYQNGALVATRVIPAGEVLIQTIEFPVNAPFSVMAVVNGSVDGPIWMADGVTEVEVASGTTTTIPETDPLPNAPITATPNTPAPPTADPKKSIWSSVNSENSDSALTAKTYAEGIDKLAATLQTSDVLGVDTVTTPEIDTDGVGVAKARVDSLLGAIPAAPQIQAPTAASAVFSSPVFAVNGATYGATYDLSPYSGGINVFRGIAQGVMYILFFIIYVREIRKAFAS